MRSRLSGRLEGLDGHDATPLVGAGMLTNTHVQLVVQDLQRPLWIDRREKTEVEGARRCWRLREVVEGMRLKKNSSGTP